MEIRQIFSGRYLQLRGNYIESAQMQHPGGKGAHRESALREFLTAYLPRRYSCKKGSLVATNGQVSRECDIVIYDDFWQPQLLQSDDHTMFAADAVFGIIESKSTLSSAELRQAYKSIQDAKKTAGREKDAFFGGIVGFKADRSLDTVAKQVADLNKELEADRSPLIPNSIAVLDQGIIEPFGAAGSVRILRSGDNTLLHFFARTLNALNQIDLAPVDFSKYMNLPSHVDGHVVVGHDRFLGTGHDGRPRVLRLRTETIRCIYETCQAAGEHTLIPEDRLKQIQKQSFLGALVLGTGFVYNPSGRKILFREQVAQWNSGRAIVGPNELYPQEYIKIDGELYYLDMAAFKDSDFEEHTDFTAGELAWEYLFRW